MFSDSARLQLRKRPDLSIRTLQNDKAHANNASACPLWINHIQDCFAELEILFGTHKPWIVSVVRGQMKLNELGDFGWCCFAPLTNCQVDSWAVRSSNVYIGTWPSMLILQVRMGMNTLVGTNQDKKSPGTHLGLNVWLSSALRVPICSFPASKRNDNPLRTMANWSGGPTLNVSDLKCNSLPFVWWNHPKPHLMRQQAFKHLQHRPDLVWGGKGR